MLAPHLKSFDELRIPRILPRSESGKIKLLASIGDSRELPIGERVHCMLSLADRFLGEERSRNGRSALFGLTLASHIVASLRKACPERRSRVAEVFPRESLAVEDFLNNATLSHLHKLDRTDAIVAAKLLAEVCPAQSDSFALVSKHILASINELGGGPLVHLAQAYARFGQRDSLAFEALSQGIARRVNGLTPVLLCRLFAAYSVSGYRDERLFGQLAAKVDLLMPFFSTNQLAEVAMGFGRLALPHPAFFERLATEMLSEQRRARLSSKAVIKLAWAMAACGHDPSAVKEYVVQDPNKFTSLSPTYAHQCAQAFLAIDAPLDRVAAPIYGSSREPGPTRNGRSLERKVKDALIRECGVPSGNVHESMTIAGIESDLLVVTGGRRIIVECDGDQYHRTWGPDGGTPLGKDIVQDRARERLGYSVVHVLASDFFGERSPEVLSMLRQALRG